MSNIIKSNIDYSNKRTFLPVEKYLPSWALETEFFNDIVILLNYLEDSIKDFSNPKYAQIAEFYKDIYFKYKNIDLLTEEELKAIVRENGYGLIVDTLDVDIDKLKTIVVYLPLFKILKSTDAGYKFLLSLVSYDFEIETWLDNPQELDEYTYNIVYITFLNTGFDASIVDGFIKLSRFYVYPVLKSIVIKVIYRDRQPYVHGLPLIQKAFKLQCLEELYLTLTIRPIPENSIVVLESSGGTQQDNSISVSAGSTVNYTVSKLGYFTQTDSILMNRTNITLDIVLEQGIYLQIFPTPADAEVTFELVYPIIDGGSIEEPVDILDGGSAETLTNCIECGSSAESIDITSSDIKCEINGNIITTMPGTEVKYTVSKEGYQTVSDTILLDSNKSIIVELQSN